MNDSLPKKIGQLLKLEEIYLWVDIRFHQNKFTSFINGFTPDKMCKMSFLISK